MLEMTDKEKAERISCDLKKGISWPRGEREKIYPVFLPFMGCQTRCAFCSQEKQTGQSSDWKAVQSQMQAAERFLKNKRGDYKLAFYGGTFTALEDNRWNDCLEFAAALKKRRLIQGFVCSTRPDKLTPARVTELVESGCMRVELGVQTFAEKALAACGRPYTAKICSEVIAELARTALPCCVQLMPGFPFAPENRFLEDVKMALAWGVRLFRFYPCLVFKHTPLAKWHSVGAYRPLSLAKAIELTAEAWLMARFAGAKILRIGVMLAAEEREALQGGPFDEAFGNRVMAAGIYRLLSDNEALRSAAKTGTPFTLFVPAFTQGYFWGWQGNLKDKWRALGVSGNNLVFTSEARIWLSGGKM